MSNVLSFFETLEFRIWKKKLRRKFDGKIEGNPHPLGSISLSVLPHNSNKTSVKELLCTNHPCEKNVKYSAHLCLQHNATSCSLLLDTGLFPTFVVLLLVSEYILLWVSERKWLFSLESFKMQLFHCQDILKNPQGTHLFRKYKNRMSYGGCFFFKKNIISLVLKELYCW